MAKTPAWQRKAGKAKEGGLNYQGRKSYEKENPGSDLKAPVLSGNKDVHRFKLSMGNMKGPERDEKGRALNRVVTIVAKNIVHQGQG